jgi:hypothetical protein
LQELREVFEERLALLGLAPERTQWVAQISVSIGPAYPLDDGMAKVVSETLFSGKNVTLAYPAGDALLIAKGVSCD